MPQRRLEQAGQRPVARRRQPRGVPRWLSPVLPELVEPVRRRPDAHPRDDLVLVGPGIRAARMRADGQVTDDAGGHAPGQRRPLRRGQLVVGQPLQPGVKVSGGAQLPGCGHFSGCPQIPCLIGPASPVGPVDLRQRAPGRPVLQVAALPLAEIPEAGAPRAAQRNLVDDLQGSPLGDPDLVPLDKVAGGVAGPQRPGELVDVLALLLGELLILGDVLDPQVKRAGESSGHRKVRGRADRGQRLGRVQRVNQHEAGAQVAGAPGGKLGEVAQVAMAPGGTGAQRVQLDGESPRTGRRGRGGDASGACAGRGRAGRGGRAGGTGRGGRVAEGGQDRHQGFRAHRDFLAAPVPVAMRDSGRLGLPDQLRVRHRSMIA